MLWLYSMRFIGGGLPGPGSNTGDLLRIQPPESGPGKLAYGPRDLRAVSGARAIEGGTMGKEAGQQLIYLATPVDRPVAVLAGRCRRRRRRIDTRSWAMGSIVWLLCPTTVTWTCQAGTATWISSQRSRSNHLVGRKLRVDQGSLGANTGVGPNPACPHHQHTAAQAGIRLNHQGSPLNLDHYPWANTGSRRNHQPTTWCSGQHHIAGNHHPRGYLHITARTGVTHRRPLVI